MMASNGTIAQVKARISSRQKAPLLIQEVRRTSAGSG